MFNKCKTKEELLRAYGEAMTPLWAAYDEAKAPLLAAYKKAEAHLWAAYEAQLKILVEGKL